MLAKKPPKQTSKRPTINSQRNTTQTRIKILKPVKNSSKFKAPMKSSPTQITAPNLINTGLAHSMATAAFKASEADKCSKQP